MPLIRLIIKVVKYELFLGLILFSKIFYPLWVLKAVLILYFIFQIPMALRNVGKPVSGASKKLQVDPQNDQNPSKNYGDIRKCKFREFLFQWELFVRNQSKNAFFLFSASANQPKTWMLKGM